MNLSLRSWSLVHHRHSSNQHREFRLFPKSVDSAIKSISVQSFSELLGQIIVRLVPFVLIIIIIIIHIIIIITILNISFIKNTLKYTKYSNDALKTVWLICDHLMVRFRASHSYAHVSLVRQWCACL